MKTIIFTLISLSLFSSHAFAGLFKSSTYYVAPAQETGLSGEESAIMTNLLKTTLVEKGEKTTENKSNADFVVYSSIMKLGRSYLITAKKINTKTQNTVFTTKQKTTSLDDLDILVSRVAESIIKESKVEGAQEIGAIAEGENNRYANRTETFNQTYAGLGTGFTNNLDGKAGGYNFTFGYLWNVDPKFALDFGGQLYFGGSDDSSTFSSIHIGALYLPFLYKYSPYLGVNMGFGFSKADTCANPNSDNCLDDKLASGWQLGVRAGYMFFRTSKVNLGIDAGYNFIVKDNSYGKPGLTTIGINVHF